MLYGGALIVKVNYLGLVEYGVSTSIEYGVSSSLSNTAYSSQQINMAYPLPLDTTKSADILPLLLENLTQSYNNINIELNKEFLEELQKNTYQGWIDEDIVNHIAKVLKIVDLIHVPDDSILSSNNTTSDSFFKPYLKSRGKSDTEKEDEQSQTKRANYAVITSIDEQPNKRRCKAEKFDAIQYSLRPNEENIAIRSYEYDIWERNEDNLSIIYQDIFQKKDEGWKDLVKEISTNVGGEFKNLEILKCWNLETSRRLFNMKSCS
ncbi:hypothetical protein Tco_0287739 [Tanacetum coccineum]